MKLIIFLAAIFFMNQGFAAASSALLNINKCLASLRDDADVMNSDIDNVGIALITKHSNLNRSLFIVNSNNAYACGEMKKESANSTADVLNFEINLIIDRKSYPLLVEIPTTLTFNAEDVIFRESSAIDQENLNCNKTEISSLDAAILDTIGTRLKGFPIEFEENVIDKKHEEAAAIWGADWKAKVVIDQKRNQFLKVLKKCSLIPILLPLTKNIQSELSNIK